MSLTEKEAKIIRNAIEDIRKDILSMASTVREQAKQISSIGERTQKLQENFQVIMSDYKSVPVEEINATITAAKDQINILSNLAKKLKSKKEF